jgi:hypothetical protein
VEGRASNGKIGYQKVRRYSKGYQMEKQRQFFRWLPNVSHLKPLKPGLQIGNKVTKGYGGTQIGIKWENQEQFFRFFLGLFCSFKFFVGMTNYMVDYKDKPTN